MLTRPSGVEDVGQLENAVPEGRWYCTTSASIKLAHCTIQVTYKFQHIGLRSAGRGDNLI